jgi:AraC-like DNA-binding protein
LTETAGFCQIRQNNLGWGEPAVNIEHKRRSSTATVKVRNAAAVASTLIALGVDPAIVLMKAGVEPATFANPANTLPYATLGRLVAVCVEATGCDDFGLQVGVRSEPTIMGLTGIVSINSPTVRDGIGVILATLRTTDTGGEAFLSVRHGLASFGYAVVAPGIEAAEQIEDASVAIALNVMRQFFGQAWRPLRVRFARKPPRDRRRFKQFFGAPLLFDQPRTCIEFDAAALDLPVQSHNAAYAEILAPLLEQAVRETTPDFLSAARSIIRTEVASGTLSRDRLCKALRLNARTLSNRLEAHGVTYSKLADEARFEAARDLLLRGRPIADIASSLGFAEQSAFTRAFKTWAGAPPARWLADRAPPGT